MISSIDQESIFSSPEKIDKVLQEVIHSLGKIAIHLSGNEQTFYANLTESDPSARCFFISFSDGTSFKELSLAMQNTSDNPYIWIDCHLRSGKVSFQVGFDALTNNLTKQAVRINFPDEVLYTQRRHTYRVDIPPAHEILLDLTLPNGSSLKGQLVDMSENGFKAKFKGNQLSVLLSQHDQYQAEIRFNAEHTIDASLRAKHVVLNSGGDTVCGFLILTLSPHAQRFINRLITEFQWENRQLIKNQQLSLSE